MREKLLVAVTAALLMVLGSTLSVSASTAPPLPSSMASTGDSITRAFDSTWWGCFLSDCPQYSWSTGTSGSVNSQYRRILARSAAINGHAYNDAKTGAKMIDLDGQLTTAAAQRVQYVTVLMGANDVCTSSAATMTPTATFKAQLDQALANFYKADPKAHVYVSSLPDIYQLWKVLNTNSSAASAWSSFNICQSMLSKRNGDAERQLVVAREKDDNAVLAEACARYSQPAVGGDGAAQCLWDGYAGYRYQFPASQISNIDYFHPNVSGENAVASVTLAAGYWR